MSIIVGWKYILNKDLRSFFTVAEAFLFPDSFTENPVQKILRYVYRFEFCFHAFYLILTLTL